MLLVAAGPRVKRAALARFGKCQMDPPPPPPQAVYYGEHAGKKLQMESGVGGKGVGEGIDHPQ